MEKPLVKNTYLLKKYYGRGGWTCALIPEILQNKKTRFGWVKVKGSIEGYQIKSYKLMPLSNGQLFLPVKAEIRKKIEKGEGDYISVILYADNDPLEIPEEFLLCLKDEPVAYYNFIGFIEGEKKAFID